MELVYQVATLAELDEILAFGEERLKESEPDPTARQFKSWKAPWRRESLEHYLRTGWSFVVRHGSSTAEQKAPLAGFFLAQPFLFMRGMTQTLWIEHISADSPGTHAGLVDVAVRMGRDKHLQRVLFAGGIAGETDLQNFKHALLPDQIIEVPTTKG